MKLFFIRLFQITFSKNTFSKNINLIAILHQTHQNNKNAEFKLNTDKQVCLESNLGIFFIVKICNFIPIKFYFDFHILF